jgi:hypothetical protein
MGWWTPASPDGFGGIARRYPVAAAGTLLSLASLAAALLRRAWPAGMKAVFAVACASAPMVILSPWRADPAAVWLGMRAEAWAGLAMLMAAVLAALRLRRGPGATA